MTKTVNKHKQELDDLINESQGKKKKKHKYKDITDETDIDESVENTDSNENFSLDSDLDDLDIDDIDLKEKENSYNEIDDDDDDNENEPENVKTKKHSDSYNKKLKKAQSNADNKMAIINESMSSFEKQYKILIKRLKANGVNVNTDTFTLKALHTMLQTTLSLVPIVEKSVRKYNGQGNSTQSYTMMVTKVVELMDAIRSISDLSTQVDYIQNDIVFNSFRYMIQNLGQEIDNVKRWGKLELNQNESQRLSVKLDDMFKNHGIYIKELLGKIESELNKYLLGK